MRTLVVIPTFQEADNVVSLLRALRRTCPQCDLLIVDDSSPDGTAEKAEQVARELGAIEVVRRLGHRGLGSAYRDGFVHGLNGGYEILVSMDADLSHDPNALPALIDAASREGVGLAIGSRYVPGGAILNWPFYRRAMSRFANVFASLLLGAGITDMTSGYRAYRAEAVRAMYKHPMRIRGFGIQIEMAHRVSLQGAEVVEVPIAFVDRSRGTSKMTASIGLETLWQVTRIGVGVRLGSFAQRVDLARARLGLSSRKH